MKDTNLNNLGEENLERNNNTNENINQNTLENANENIIENNNTYVEGENTHTQNTLENAGDNLQNSENIEEIQEQTHASDTPGGHANNEQGGTTTKPYVDFETWKKEQESKQHRNSKVKKMAAGAIAGVGIFAIGIFAGNALFGGGQDILPNSIFNADNNIGATDRPILQIDNTANIGMGKGLTGEEIYAKLSPSVVSIVSENISSQDEGSGSGIVMSSDGYIITNNHVIEGGDKLTVILHDGTTHEAEVIGADAKTDLAVIKIHPDEKLTVAEFGNSDNLLVGERAFAIGSPSGIELQNTLTGGYISAINRDVTVEDRVMTLIQTDTSINPGNSGGPLINQYGQVIGINTIKIGISYYEGLGFAIPINSAKEIVDELLVNGYIKGRPAIGISGRNISEGSSKQYNMPMGILVDFVDPRGGAAAGGLKKGDIITGVNGVQTPTMGDINNEKEKFKAGDKMKLDVYRAGRNINIDIILVDEKVLESPTVQEQPQSIPQDNFFGLPFFNIP